MEELATAPPESPGPARFTVTAVPEYENQTRVGD